MSNKPNSGMFWERKREKGQEFMIDPGNEGGELYSGVMDIWIRACIGSVVVVVLVAIVAITITIIIITIDIAVTFVIIVASACIIAAVMRMHLYQD